MNKNILISPDKNIYDAMNSLQKATTRCLIVVNKNNGLLGTLNDGDIRRSLLKKLSFKTKIKKIYKKNCFFIYENDLKKIDIKKFFIKNDINTIPIVNKKKILKDVLFSNIVKKYHTKILNKIGIIIMAGGLGTRLKPYTNIVPKPLLVFNRKTIIENVIDPFFLRGFKKFIISVNYKNILIKSFFKDLKPRYKISYLNETKPLGTAGILSKLKNKNKNFLISNCDTIIDIDLEDLYQFHEKKKFDLTVVIAAKSKQIPYGVCIVSKDRIRQIKEKPKEEYYANTGLYLANSKIFKLLKNNKSYTFVDLIELCLKQKYKVGAYPISEFDWQDVGQSIDSL